MRYTEEEALSLAKNPNTSPKTLDTLIFSQNSTAILSTVLRNPNLSPKTLLEYGHHAPKSFIENPSLPILLLAEPGFLQNSAEKLANALLEIPDLSKEILVALLYHKKSTIRTNVLSHQNITEKFLLNIAQGNDDALKNCLIEKGGLSKETLEALAFSTSMDIRLFVARHPKTPRHTLQNLQNDSEPSVRQSAQYRLLPEPSCVELPSIRCAAKTDVGISRAHNEDACFVTIDKKRAIFCVADGMGGQSSGSIASEEFVRIVSESMTFAEKGFSFLSKLFTTAYFGIRKKCHEYSCRGTSTTAAVLLVEGQKAYLAHVGMDRIYRLRDKVLSCLTEDHSLLNEIRKVKNFSEKEIKEFPYKNVITKTVGMTRLSGLPSFREEEILPDDIFLLCSDGVHTISEDKIATLLLSNKEKEPKYTVDALLQAAEQAESKDNLSAIVIYF